MMGMINDRFGIHSPLSSRQAPAHTVESETLHLPDVWAAGYTGEGIGIAVIDSGIVPHPDLDGKIVAFQDFYEATTQPTDAHGHGTGVSVVAAGSGKASEGFVTGAAPGAHVVALRIGGADGMTYARPALAAIEWAIENRERYNIRVLNMSFSLDDRNIEDRMPVIDALKRASDLGMIPVAAAGNEGPFNGRLGTIASYPFVVTVAAADPNGTSSTDDDSIAGFSSHGPGENGQEKPDVAAPGVDVTIGTRTGGYRTANGTSFSSPMVAGVVADWLQANPKLDVSDVQHIIRETSRPIPGERYETQGAGQIDPVGGLQMALAMAAEPDPATPPPESRSRA